MLHEFNFEYCNPTKLLFGKQKIRLVEKLIPATATVLLVYGGGSIKQNGIYQQVSEALQGHHFIEFGGIESNPTYETLSKAVDTAKRNHVDFVLAVGGGSVIDGAKYIAAASCYSGNGWDLVTKQTSIAESVPLGVVLTLAATGSESNGISVISRLATNEKLAFSSPLLNPKFAVLDPYVLMSLPDRQLANGLVDAFVHVTEQYLTYPVNGLIQDGYAETVMKTLYRLACNFSKRKDISWLQNLMWAANQALNGILGVGVPQDFSTHTISAELTANYGIDHARTLSILHPSLLRETIIEKEAKLIQLGEAVFGLESPSAYEVINAIEAMYLALEMPVSLQMEGINDKSAPQKILTGLQRKQVSVLAENGILNIERIERVVQKSCGLY